MITINQKNYEVIEFIDKRPFRETNIPKTRRAALVGNYLAVVPNQVFRLDNGLPMLDVKFATLEDAVKFAEWISNIFSEYFVIWEEYPDADIFAMAKWSVPNGLMAYEAVKIIKSKAIIKENEMQNVKSEALANSHYWTEQLTGRSSREVRQSAQV